MRRAWIAVLVAAVGVMTTRGAGTKPVVLAFLSPEADKHNVEFQQYSRLKTLYAENNIAPCLAPFEPLYSASETEEQIYQELKPFHAVVLCTTSEGDATVRLTPAMEARGRTVGAALARYVHDGGGLFVQAQSVRYPNTDDEKYWNIVLAPLGITILHEGCFDPTRAFQGFDLGPAIYWHTRNIKPHPVTEGVLDLYLPLHGPGTWPGVPALKYSPEWQVVVAGEKEAKSFQSDRDNALQLTQAGTYRTAPPVVAVRSLGKGRIVSFPLAPIHSGMNYGNPLWKNTVETDGDKAAGLPSFGLKLLLNADRWAAAPAQADPAFGTHVSPPYTPVRFPAKVDWDRLTFDAPDGGVKGFAYPDGQKPDFAPLTAGVRGILGARSAYAGGQGSVAEYVKAAKAAGLSFIVFNDPLEKLTAAKLEQLKADCAAASKDGDFYACPGIEFTDGIGDRWAFWGEKVIFPADSFADNDQRTYKLWDGQRVLQYGQYIASCAFVPSALIDYRQLRANGAHPENLWWFYNYLPFVYDKGQPIADNYGEFLHGLNDLRWAAVDSFTRIDNPTEVAAAAQTCFTGFKDLTAARAGLNTRCGAYGAALAGREYVSQGPAIACWDAIDPQMEDNWQQTRGAQRVRLKFVVRSDKGIADVRVHDADRGLIRRFRGGGQKELTREFEVVHDQQHYLTLEVTDTAGKRAISWYVLVFSYKQGLFRCGDNLNILGGTGLIWHPDRNEMMPMAKQWENGMDFGINGWDSGGYLCPMPGAWGLDAILIQDKKDYYPNFRQDGMVGKILDLTLSSYNIQIASQRMTMLSEEYSSATRTVPALATVPRDKGPLEFFERTHTIYALMTRTDWYTAWNYRRPHEGAKDYRGGLILHEGEIKFTKDVTLRGPVPIQLVSMRCPVDLDQRWGDMAIVTDANGQTRVGRVTDLKKPFHLSGRLRGAGYASLMPSLVGYQGFFAPAGFEYSYDAVPGRIEIGLGQDGQAIKAGTSIPYRFVFATLANAEPGNAVLADTAAALNLDGGRAGYPLAMKAGEFVDGVFFFTAKAKQNEALFTVGPRELIVDLGFRIEGLADNGCAAVSTTKRPWFRFVPVVNGAAWFQEPIDRANEIWAGNIFVCDNPAVKLAVVVDGQADGKPPFIEAHNPTDQSIKAKIWSPAHTPLFGGIEASLEIPAGDSVRLRINGKQLEAAK